MAMTMEQAIKEYKKTGGNWFNNKEMTWWGCELVTGLLDGNYFISKEWDAFKEKKLFTIRRFSDDFHNVETVGDFQAYVSKTNAIMALDVIRRKDEMMQKAGYREREILSDITKVVPFQAARPHKCFAIFSGNKECVYDFYEGRFVA